MAQDRFSTALALHRAGRSDEAARLYRRVIAYEPRHAGALHMLAAVLLAEDRAAEAVTLLERSIAAEPGIAVAHYNLGCAHQALGHAAASERAYARAVELDPGHAPSHMNRSGVLLQLSRPGEAFEAARRAAELAPHAAAHCNAGLALKATGDARRAEEMFRAALARDPRHAESLHNLANLVRLQSGREEEARAILADLTRAHPRMIAPRIALAQMLREACEGEAAAAELEAAAAISPDDLLVRLALTTAPLQAFYMTERDRTAARAGYGRRLQEFDTHVRAGGPERLAALSEVAGYSQPFFLPYAGGPQAGSVDRDLQARYGALMADAARARYGDAPLASPPAAGERIRVGFVSGYMREHSNWKIPLRGWMEGLDRDRFEVFGYYTADVTQAQTGLAASLCSRFLQGPRTTGQWREAIIADAPHALIYPETGMDGAAFRLACQHLAPVQCVSWGHPVTSGLPTMHAFLSSDAMEPPDAQAHYTERLIRLPGLGICYRPETLSGPRPTRERLGLPDAPLFFCGQALFKYAPRHDAILARIAASVPDARFVFVDAPQGRLLREKLRERLSGVFDAGRHVLILDRLERSDYVGLSGLCDVVLDSLEWSGCNSTLECLPLGTPIVTLPGETMRARHTAAILSEIGEVGGIARCEDEYVDLAVRLARDRALGRKWRARIVANWTRATNDRRPVEALERFLVEALRPDSGNFAVSI